MSLLLPSKTSLPIIITKIIKEIYEIAKISKFSLMESPCICRPGPALLFGALTSLLAAPKA